MLYVLLRQWTIMTRNHDSPMTECRTLTRSIIIIDNNYSIAIYVITTLMVSFENSNKVMVADDSLLSKKAKTTSMTMLNQRQ